MDATLHFLELLYPPLYAGNYPVAKGAPFRVLPGTPTGSENGSPNGPEMGPKMDPQKGTRNSNPETCTRKLELETRNSNSSSIVELEVELELKLERQA